MRNPRMRTQFGTETRKLSPELPASPPPVIGRSFQANLFA
jgi:hypothetical protein